MKDKPDNSWEPTADPGENADTAQPIECERFQVDGVLMPGGSAFCVHEWEERIERHPPDAQGVKVESRLVCAKCGVELTPEMPDPTWPKP